MVKSVSNYIKGLQILASHLPHGMDEAFFMEAEHDIIYSHVGSAQIEADSDEAKLLEEYGFHLDEDVDVWAYFT
jgi:hypothetical protein